MFAELPERGQEIDTHFESDARERVSDRLSDRKACAIASLVNGETVEEAAQLAGVHRSTLYRWYQDPEFVRALERAKRDHLELLQCELNSLATVAVRTLCNVLKGHGHTIELRLKLAREILKAAGIEHPGTVYLRDDQNESRGLSSSALNPFMHLAAASQECASALGDRPAKLRVAKEQGSLAPSIASEPDTVSEGGPSLSVELPSLPLAQNPILEAPKWNGDADVLR